MRAIVVPSMWMTLILFGSHFYTQALGLEEENSCQFVFDSSIAKSGNFSSVGFFVNEYPPNSKCTYLFNGGRYEVLNITFHVFELEMPFTKGCLKDYIDISTITMYNVKKLVGRFCGTQVPNPLISMHPKAEIVFKSDHVVNNRGFYATYHFMDESRIGVPVSTISNIEGCGGVQMGSSGVIQSPEFPEPFPTQMDCMWVIRVQQNQHIYIRMLDLQLFGSIANCKEAVVSIYDGYENYDFSPKEPKRFCGDLRYYKGVEDRVELSSDNRLLIRFRSDITSNQWTKQVKGSGVRMGFKLVWTAVHFSSRDECKGFLCENSEYCLEPKSLSTCAKSRFFCIDQSLACNEFPNCSEQDSSDEDSCGFTSKVSVVSGAISSILFFLVIFAFCYCKSRCRRVKHPKFVEESNRDLDQVEISSFPPHPRHHHPPHFHNAYLRQDFSPDSDAPSSSNMGHSIDPVDMFLPPPPPSILLRSSPSPIGDPGIINCSIHGPSFMTTTFSSESNSPSHFPRRESTPTDV